MSPHSVADGAYSARSTTPGSPLSPVETDAKFSMMFPQPLGTVSHISMLGQHSVSDYLSSSKSNLLALSVADAQDQGLFVEEFEHSPPPPPLPPLEWCMMRRFNDGSSFFVKAMGSSVRHPAAPKFVSTPLEPLKGLNLPTLNSPVKHVTYTSQVPPIEACMPSWCSRGLAAEAADADDEEEQPTCLTQMIHPLQCLSYNTSNSQPADEPVAALNYRRSVGHEDEVAEKSSSSHSKEEVASLSRLKHAEKDMEPPQAAEALRLARSSIVYEVQRKDPLVAAISSHDQGMSFSLRHKENRPAASINVAVILEKANAIRQAFAGSDDDVEDDDWSDS